MKLILGAGTTIYKGWTATDINDLNLINYKDWERQYEKNSIDAMLSEHVWEHMSIEEGLSAAKNCFNYLKPGGYIRVAVPDAYFRNDWYQNMVQVGGPGPIDHPAYGHKVVYNYKTLKKLFQNAGFVVTLLEYCDEDGAFHYTYWNHLDGHIGRSYRYDTRNQDGKLGMVSLIIDAKKEQII